MSKGGSTTTSVEVPEYIEEAAKRNLNRAEGIANLGFVPRYGPDVAAPTPLQEASMRNTASAAGAFGLAGSGDPMAGMPQAQTFAGGVRGYSSAPIFEQSVSELQARRPGQYDYMQSFFIDPVTGLPGSRVADPIDYTQPVDGGDTGGGSDGDDAFVAAPVTQERTPYGTTPVSASDEGLFGSGDYYGAFSENYEAASRDAAQNPTGMTYGTPIYDQGYVGISDPITNTIGAAINRSPVGRVGTAITGEPMLPDVSSLMAPTVDLGGYNPTPTIMPDPLATGGTRDDVRASSSGDVDLPGNVLTRTLNIGAGRRDDSSDSGYAGEADDGCVIATHAVASGGFTPSMKREAVVWCMNVLHDKWWGEAIRRGYRHLGRKKIEQGKAHEHYAEFRDYIAFANGKKRTFKGAVNFSLRTAQFLAVGLVKKDA